MSLIPVGAEVASVKLFDSKFEAGARAAAKAALQKAYKTDGKHELGDPEEGGFFILLKPAVALDGPGRALIGTCTWEVFVIENGQRKMYPSIKQSKQATSTAKGIRPDKILPRNVNDAVAGAVEAEMLGILKKLPK